MLYFPFVERGIIILIGATTEKPLFWSKQSPSFKDDGYFLKNTSGKKDIYDIILNALKDEG